LKLTLDLLNTKSPGPATPIRGATDPALHRGHQLSLIPMRVQSSKTGGKPLPLRTARPDCASGACHLSTNV